MKKRHFLLAFASASLMLAACGGNGKQPVETTETTETEVVEEETEVTPEAVEEETEVTTEEAEPAPAIVGELGLFELRGPVKSCTWKTQYATTKMEFDKNGLWTKNDGQKPWAYYPNVKRDKQGRLVKMDNGDESTEYTYDQEGRITHRVINYMDGCDDTRWEYDAAGDCVKNINSYAGEGAEEGDENRVSTYTITERDDHGNWTKRKDQNGQQETRTITYYE